MNLDSVSARAEAQVRDRIKGWFRVPGAWTEENLEGKTILRAIIAERGWPQFRSCYLERRVEKPRAELYRRTAKAVAEGRLCSCGDLSAGASANLTEESITLRAA